MMIFLKVEVTDEDLVDSSLDPVSGLKQLISCNSMCQVELTKDWASSWPNSKTKQGQKNFIIGIVWYGRKNVWIFILQFKNYQLQINIRQLWQIPSWSESFGWRRPFEPNFEPCFYLHWTTSSQNPLSKVNNCQTQYFLITIYLQRISSRCLWQLSPLQGTGKTQQI